MTALAPTLQRSPEALAVLGSITPDRVGLIIATPIFGRRTYQWSAGEDSERLDNILNCLFEADHGTYAEAYTENRVDAWLDAHAAFPTTEAVLAARFGNPTELFGLPPQSVLTPDHVERAAMVRRWREGFDDARDELEAALEVL